ncbi:MAG TPA: hypothetical protein VEU31_02485 [Candidatus Acidoferrales bacterium]|nr:hypothetical protein [Candidatus Acidoferrales bacterium]
MNNNPYLSPQLRNAFAVFAAIAGLIGVAVTLLTAPSRMRTAALLFLFGLAIVLAIAIGIPEILKYARAARALPSDTELDSLGTAYGVEQATHGDIGWIAKLEASVYSKEDAIPEHLLSEWYSMNPTGFSIIKAADGRPTGHLDILPLRPATLEAFLRGDIVEHEIRGDSLYSVRDRSLIRHLYVESIILLPRPHSRAAAIVAVLSNLSSIIERITHLQTVERIYAIAATPSGERLMRRLGFDLVSQGERRKDGHNLFGAQPSVLASAILAICGSRVAQGDAVWGLTRGL